MKIERSNSQVHISCFLIAAVHSDSAMDLIRRLNIRKSMQFAQENFGYAPKLSRLVEIFMSTNYYLSHANVIYVVYMKLINEE